MKISDLIPDVDVLVRMAPEELGGAILEIMNSPDTVRDHRGMMTINQLHSDLFQAPEPIYPLPSRDAVWRAIAEAWAWLEGQALIIWPDNYNGANGFRIISRRGAEIAGREGIAAYRQASLLPKALLHDSIVEHSLIDFQRGESRSVNCLPNGRLRVLIQAVPRLRTRSRIARQTGTSIEPSERSRSLAPSTSSETTPRSPWCTRAGS
jgi:hypothetical protein